MANYYWQPFRCHWQASLSKQKKKNGIYWHAYLEDILAQVWNRTRSCIPSEFMLYRCLSFTPVGSDRLPGAHRFLRQWGRSPMVASDSFHFLFIVLCSVIAIRPVLIPFLTLTLTLCCPLHTGFRDNLFELGQFSSHTLETRRGVVWIYPICCQTVLCCGRSLFTTWPRGHLDIGL